MKQIESSQDVEFLVNQFYLKVKNDAMIGFFFKDIMNVNCDLHLPKMYQFWESLLLGKSTYKGNTMAKHFPINKMAAMEKSHFDHWLKIWMETVDDTFKGEIA